MVGRLGRGPTDAQLQEPWQLAIELALLSLWGDILGQRAALAAWILRGAWRWRRRLAVAARVGAQRLGGRQR